MYKRTLRFLSQLQDAVRLASDHPRHVFRQPLACERQARSAEPGTHARLCLLARLDGRDPLSIADAACLRPLVLRRVDAPNLVLVAEAEFRSLTETLDCLAGLFNSERLAQSLAMASWHEAHVPCTLPAFIPPAMEAQVVAQHEIKP